MKPKREYATIRPWKRIICIFRGHDFGMYWNGRDGYDDVCVRCGKKKRPKPRRATRDNVTDISHRLRVPPPSKL